MPSPAALSRRHDLDWLRVLLIGLVFLFHSGRFFDLDDWHVKNARTYLGMQLWSAFMILWLMPAIFVISGASTFLALGTSGRQFIKDKVRRLLVPFAVGVFTHIAVQVYLERLSHRQFVGTFVEFLPHYFDGMYGVGGNFAWMGLHLWYLLLLFTLSVLLLPVFRWLKGRGARTLTRLGEALALPLVVYLLAAPIVLLVVSLDPRTPMGIRHFGGWPPLSYLLFYMYGFIVISHDGLWQRVMRQRWISLCLGIASFATMYLIWRSHGIPAVGTTAHTQISAAFAIGGWCWVLAICGFGGKCLNFDRPGLQRANEAVLPFYVLHQTVLIVVGYFVVQQPMPDFLKWLGIAMASFVIIIGLCELIRRMNLLRFLFGMKASRATP